MQDASIAIIAPLQPEDFFDLLWQGVWEATFDLASFGVQVRNLTTDRHDVAEQQKILTQLLEEKLDGIAIIPAHSSALDTLINQHESRGTPVVTFHGDAPESRRSAFVGPDPFQAGVLAAELLAKFMGGRGQVLSFPGSAEKYHLVQRDQGLRAELANHSGCTVTAASIPDLEAFEQLPEQLRRQLESANGIYVGNEDLVKVATAMEQAGLSVPCVGFGNTLRVQPFLARNMVSAVIREQRYLQGYFAVQKAYEAVLKRSHGGSMTGIRIPCDVTVAANAGESGESLHTAFEMLVRQRTEVLISYKQRLEQANAELLNLSTTDALTGLFNRRKFEEVLQGEVARANRYGPLSLLMIDLNYFKQVNDRFGHLAGDEVLKRVAQLLKACCRTTDSCARLGGDEFALILPHADREAAAVVRNRMLKEAAATAVHIEGRDVPLSFSVGMATLLTDGTDAGALIAAADAEMYRMKQAAHTEADFELAG